MSLHLRDDLSFCQVDGNLVFLDVRNDRYFRLPAAAERRFLAYQRGDGTDSDAEKLIESGLLTTCETSASRTPAISIARANQSAIERGQIAQHATLLDRLDTVRTVALSQLQLKTRSLSHVLTTLKVDRQRRALPISYPQSSGADGKFHDATSAFLAARPYAPIETCCLVDSISLIRFLARRGLFAHLVFAVTGAPFSAHCWAQVGDLVLNETVGNTHAHTPIRVV
ncbi:lasso peptide biosynthesis B2 protein [Luteimonas terrae]|uniref:Microcin J25-processing protein McjB C-terminal domain-containing protein n=1 Tax=Luteimonas terrae TaxID=1530191 RepID=A0ABU1XYZ0_9GAMM|nr:lasso peptide biosynthesis B2 protein [Luteimonas terrae]MDR7193281.1 hypothetical protein [Luteimonas terrae]